MIPGFHDSLWVPKITKCGDPLTIISRFSRSFTFSKSCKLVWVTFFKIDFLKWAWFFLALFISNFENNKVHLWSVFKVLLLFRWSTCPLAFGCWLLDHVISLKLREIVVWQSEQIHKMWSFFTQTGPRLSFWVKLVVILWICSACKQLFLSQLEINHVIQQLPAV